MEDSVSRKMGVMSRERWGSRSQRMGTMSPAKKIQNFQNRLTFFQKLKSFK